MARSSLWLTLSAICTTTLCAAPIADSVADWSGDPTQGHRNWFYGYYDQTRDFADGNKRYDLDDFRPFDPRTEWNGKAWDLKMGAAPLTELNEEGGHPAANAKEDPSVHWAVRRWISTATGLVEIHCYGGEAGRNGLTKPNQTFRRQPCSPFESRSPHSHSP
jgi:hypothetical protein